MNFGSVRKFAVEHPDWGIDRFTGLFLDPTQLSFEEGHFGLRTTQRADHALILQQARVRHFHFKDALATDTLSEYQLPHANRAMVKAMQELDYRRWVIIESDKGPQPVASSVMLNSWYLQNELMPLLG